MNTTIMRAMFEDARQQVLDNKVFRLLIILTAIPILFAFLVGFHEEHVSFMWGVSEITYAELPDFIVGGSVAAGEAHVAAIQFMQELFVAVFAGIFGMILCVAATAFFAPKILEKGAADTLFSKPVGRMTVLMSRYLAGILFVAFISIVLVVGMYLGFLIVSGYNDPGFLWGALTLVYLYSMMHSFSIAIAVWTRSSTAAIILTIILFMVCGAIHGGWIGYMYFEEQSQVAEMRSGSSSDDDESEEGEEEDETHPAVVVLANTLSTLHYVLPKTSDADLITAKLRRAITEKDPVVESEDGDLIIKLAPEDFTRVEGTEGNLETTGVEWASDREGGAEVGHVSVRRYERPDVERTIGSRTRVRPLTAKDASKAFMEELEEQGETPDSDDMNISNVRVLQVSWTPVAGGTKRERLFLSFGEYMYEIDFLLANGTTVVGSGEPTNGGQPLFDEREEWQWRRRFLQDGNLVLGQVAGMDPAAWWEKTFDWDAELKYNIFFSIGSSLAFIFAMLGFAWLRLRKIDF